MRNILLLGLFSWLVIEHLDTYGIIALFRKEFDVPEAWRGKRLRLTL